MSIPIRQGYHTADLEKVKAVKKLGLEAIIELKEEKYQYCKNCTTQIVVSEQFLREGVTTCPVCTKTAKPSKNIIYQVKITKINYAQIIKLCSNELNHSLGKQNCPFDKERHCWICSINGKNIPVFISEISSYNQFVNNKIDPSWLCIVLDWEENKGKLNNYNQLNFVRIEDILEHNDKVSKQIDLISTSFDSNATVELEKKFNDFIKDIESPEFESEFVNKLIRRLKEKTVEIERYLSFLSVQKDTVTNSKAVFMGYAANADFALINLHEYLQQALKPDKIGEAKRYHHNDLHSTRFSWSDFADALAHADGSDTLFIISTNNIAPSVWRHVIEKRHNAGYFKNVIIEKDTLLLLIKVLGMEDLLSLDTEKTTVS